MTGLTEDFNRHDMVVLSEQFESLRESGERRLFCLEGKIWRD